MRLRTFLITLLVALVACQPVHATGYRYWVAGNMQQVGEGLRHFEELYGRFPTDIVDARGEALLSWRVALLPFVEQLPLYNRFQRKERWDAWPNKDLIGSMRYPYRNPWFQDDTRTGLVMP